MYHRPQVISLALDGASRRLLVRTTLLMLPSGRRRAGAGRDAAGDRVEPGPQRVAHPERAGSTPQDQEGRLEGVVGVVLIAQEGPAGAEDHRPVPLDQGGERGLG